MQVVIMLKNGVVKLLKRPKGVEVILRDYDIEGSAEDINETGLKNNEYGDYVEITLDKEV